MKWSPSLLAFLIACGASVERSSSTASAAPLDGPRTVYAGACDASGALLLEHSTMLVVDDEDNTLRAFDLDGQARGSSSLDAALGVSKEVDFEAMARTGDTLWLIGSHGRSKSGKWRADRHRLVAITASVDTSGLVIEQRGYRDDLADFLREAMPALDAALGPIGVKRADLSPKESGVSIEGLSSTDSGALLIGFRNPASAGRAIVLTLSNANAWLAGAAPELGPVYSLDLGGLRIRSLERVGSRYVIIAGARAGGGHSELWTWSGLASDPASRIGELPADLNPEALFVVDATQLMLLSDDGNREISGAKCKKLPPSAKRFRGVSLVRP